MSFADLAPIDPDWVTEPADPSAWCYEPQIYHAACELIGEDVFYDYELTDAGVPIFGLSDGKVIAREYRPWSNYGCDVYELLEFECSCGAILRVRHFADLTGGDE